MLIEFIGKVIRVRAPKIYKLLNQIILRIRKKDYLFISDHFGSSFKNYISNNKMDTLLDRLKENLDEISMKTIDVIYQRILNYPEQRYNQIVIPNKKNLVGGLLDEEKIEFNPRKVKKKYNIKLSNRHIECSIFEYYHGIKLLPDSIQKYLEGKVFLDIGAYVGDSAIALRKYNYEKIYSVEMSELSITEYKLNMKRNSIGEEKYEILNFAVASKEGLGPVKIIDSGSAGLTLFKDNPYNFKEISVELKTMDSIINDFNIKPSFIKMDIEGYAMDCIIGGLKSLKKFRPVLSIAIYHNPIEFFEVKPLLEKELTNYIFMIRKLSNLIENNSCHAETFLLAYPREMNNHV